jgi:hypothetical protein
VFLQQTQSLKRVGKADRDSNGLETHPTIHLGEAVKLLSLNLDSDL